MFPPLLSLTFLWVSCGLGYFLRTYFRSLPVAEMSALGWGIALLFLKVPPTFFTYVFPCTLQLGLFPSHLCPPFVLCGNFRLARQKTESSCKWFFFPSRKSPHKSSAEIAPHAGEYGGIAYADFGWSRRARQCTRKPKAWGVSRRGEQAIDCLFRWS